MTVNTVYRATQAWGPCVEGTALVALTLFSPRYDLDRYGATFARPGHSCFGESIAERILVCPGVQGGVAGGWAFLMMKARSAGFAALVFADVNPVMVQGAIVAEIPILAGIDRRIFEEIASGMKLLVDPADRSVVVFG
ncbi:MAG TPA: DUF126 domain-containing protein [Candidatus Baltobacteraceae bacterium]